MVLTELHRQKEEMYLLSENFFQTAFKLSKRKDFKDEDRWSWSAETHVTLGKERRTAFSFPCVWFQKEPNGTRWDSPKQGRYYVCWPPGKYCPTAIVRLTLTSENTSMWSLCLPSLLYKSKISQSTRCLQHQNPTSSLDNKEHAMLIVYYISLGSKNERIIRSTCQTDLF